MSTLSANRFDIYTFFPYSTQEEVRHEKVTRSEIQGSGSEAGCATNSLRREGLSTMRYAISWPEDPLILFSILYAKGPILAESRCLPPEAFGRIPQVEGRRSSPAGCGQEVTTTKLHGG
jgi:hypothetical protein